MSVNRYPNKGRKSLWFGTEDYMTWVDTPKQGADMSPHGTTSSGTLLNGGGYSVHSYNTHREYVFEWRESSSRQDAMLMQSFYSGTYGRGKIHFIDPLIYDTNVLPAKWADPSVTLSSGGPSLVRGVVPTSTSTTDWDANMLPVTSAVYDLSSVDAGYRGTKDSVFVPRPEGYEIRLGAFYSATLTGGVYYTPIADDGTAGSDVQLTAQANDAATMLTSTVSTGKGVRVWFGKSSADASTLTVAGVIARVMAAGGTPVAGFTTGPWMGGMGNAGCKFATAPTYIANTAFDGGRISYAATLTEVG